MRYLQQGFTLIELMTVVVVVAILATIAYPSYQQFVLSSNRVEGTKALTEIANFQEQFYLDYNRYASTLTELGYPEESETNLYKLTLENTDREVDFKVTATAQNHQINDEDCLSFSIDQNANLGGNDGCWKK